MRLNALSFDVLHAHDAPDIVLRDTRERDGDGLLRRGDNEQLPELRGDTSERGEMLARLEKEMLEAAEKLEFDVAASLRDRILELRAEAVVGGRPSRARRKSGKGRGRRAGRAAR